MFCFKKLYCEPSDWCFKILDEISMLIFIGFYFYLMILISTQRNSIPKLQILQGKTPKSQNPHYFCEINFQSIVEYSEITCKNSREREPQKT